MRNDHHNSPDEARAKPEPHETFLEFCALAASGELSAEEQEELQGHLAHCPGCRKALEEFAAAAVIGMPLLHSQLAGSDPLGADASQIDSAAANTNRVTAGSEAGEEKLLIENVITLGRAPARENGRRRPQLNWNYVWMPFAAALVLTAALGLYSYQLGMHKGELVAQAVPSAPDRGLEKLEQQISDFGHERQNLKAELAARDSAIVALHRQIAEQSTVLTETKRLQDDLARRVQADQTEKEALAQERATLGQTLDSQQAALQKAVTELDSAKQQRSQEQSRAASLEAQISDLHGQLRDHEQLLGKQQDLLAHDRDIRDLMGARDLYIAEVYDVSDDGKTQKPYGRVFYTKQKSLIFYAYDLDQEPGWKPARTFQAWGSHGPDRQQATSLGVFYEDNLAKKRWVLKFDDPKKLEQIDAVFVTVEPNGGSHKPSGKPLLFAYLKVEANHP